MSFHGYFPTTLSEKNTHYGLVIPYLNTNKVRLKIDAHPDLPLVTDRHTNGWQVNYPLASNTSTSNKTNRDDRDGDSLYIEKGLVRIYLDIPNSVYTNDDRNTLHVHTPKPPGERAKIEENVYVGLKNLGGSRLLFTCRRGSEGGHASMHEDADSIEFSGAFGATEPATIADTNVHFTSRSAHFTRDMGMDHIGQKFWVFAFYKNESDPERAGRFRRFFLLLLAGN